MSARNDLEEIRGQLKETSPAEQHDRLVNQVAGWLVVAAIIPMWWWDSHWPSWVVGIINPALVIAITWGFSRWKRSMFSRLLFWIVLAIYAVSFVVQACTAFSGWEVASGWFTTAGVTLIALVWVLWRLPRLRPVPTVVSHVVHHHVLHGPGTVLAEVMPEPARPAVAGRVLRAIEAPRRIPARIREAAGNLRPR